MTTLKQMRYFDALATTRHFGRAAELVHVSQPALSAQIAELERHLGTKLVERGRRATMLTPDGDRLLPKIRAILADVDALEVGLRRHADPLTGRLRVGIIPTVAPYLVPALVPHVRKHYPKLEIELKEAVTATLVSDLLHGQVDAVIAALPVEEDGVASRFLFEDRFLMACADDETTILMSPMAQDQVDVSRLLLLEEGHCMRDQALAVCEAAPGRRIVNYGATSMATLLQMVSHGLGLTLIPEIAVRSEGGRHRMRIVPFAEPQPSRQIGLLTRDSSGRSADFEAFAEAARTCGEALLLPGTDQATARRNAK
ncbi:hydrogen peroxide-inducible genes activator [Pararhizobium haloflavum]|uniref:hydrogen peroxide-inducible genes activator n=1 Tax=Pararhizobium haloflavum TaxID=2037914 RepID=UPI000C19A112|nr:hydrogen peroxide-inducible genes activator [Pararhizobium haloflavum]